MARAATTDQLPEGPVAHAAAGAARGFEAEHGRLPSRRELVALTGAGSGTAQRVVRALREQDGARYEVTTPVRDQAVAAAQRFAAEHGRRPTPIELARAAETSEQTARHVLRGLAQQQRDTRAGDEQAGGGRGWPSPLSDRAERAARELRERDGSWPDWRAVSEAAQVGRTTAAGVLRELKAHSTDHAAEHARDNPATAAPARAQADSPPAEHLTATRPASQHTAPGSSPPTRQSTARTDRRRPRPARSARTPRRRRSGPWWSGIRWPRRGRRSRRPPRRAAATEPADPAEAGEPGARREQLARWHADDHGHDQGHTAAAGQAAAPDAGT